MMMHEPVLRLQPARRQNKNKITTSCWDSPKYNTCARCNARFQVLESAVPSPQFTSQIFEDFTEVCIL